LVLGLVELIDAKGVDVAQPMPCEAVQHKLKNGLKTQTMHVLPVFELIQTIS